MAEKPEPSIFDTCLNITKQFEGADFDTVTGNFDGQGMSFGILQFNLRSETFQNYILNYVNMMVHDYFPVKIDYLQKANGQEAVTWAKDIMLDMNGNVKPEWETAWKKFLVNPTVINLQKNACSRYFHQAKCLAGRFGFKQEDRIAMAFFYDCAVQVWSMDSNMMFLGEEQAENILEMYDSDNRTLWIGADLTEWQKRLIIIAHVRAMKCKPEWRNAFFVRKATIALGYGIVNKQKFDFRKSIKGY